MERGISQAAGKLVYRKLADLFDRTTNTPTTKTVLEVVEENDLWIADDWTHVGLCIVICLENKKLVNNYKAGQTKVLDTLVGKTIKFANMTVDGEYIKELMPLIIQAYSWD